MHREKTMGFFWLTLGVCFLWLIFCPISSGGF